MQFSVVKVRVDACYLFITRITCQFISLSQSEMLYFRFGEKLAMFRIRIA
jgi:hypothetical protein